MGAMRALSFVPVIVVALASCAETPVGASTVHVPSASSSPPAKQESSPAAPDDGAPASAFSAICYVGHSGGQDIVVAVKEEGNAPTIGIADSKAGPFQIVVKDSSTTPFKKVIEGQGLEDSDLQESFRQANVKPAKLTVYGVFIKGGWSFGIAIATDQAGKVLVRSGWTMKPGLGRPC
jgi:hypothetical protein